MNKPGRYIRKQIITLDAQGNPSATMQEVFVPEAQRNMKLEALMLPYKPAVNHLLADPQLCATGDCECPLYPGEIDYVGLTNYEAGVRRFAERYAAGNEDTFKLFEERELGKPKQQIEQTTTVVNFFTYLEKIEQLEATRSTETPLLAPVIDVSPVEVTDTPPLNKSDVQRLLNGL